MKKLTVYTTDTCAYCSMVKKFLDMKNVEYEVVNLTSEPSRQAEAFKMSGAMTVPITTDGSDVVIGWNPARLVQLAA